MYPCTQPALPPMAATLCLVPLVSLVLENISHSLSCGGRPPFLWPQGYSLCPGGNRVCCLCPSSLALSVGRRIQAGLCALPTLALALPFSSPHPHGCFWTLTCPRSFPGTPAEVSAAEPASGRAPLCWRPPVIPFQAQPTLGFSNLLNLS